MGRLGWLGTVLVVLMTGMPFTVAGDLPFKLELHRGVRIDEVRATKIYYSVCREIAQEINLAKPPDLRPEIVLIIADKKHNYDRIEFRESGPDRIYLKKWDDLAFARAVAWAANSRVLSRDVLSRVAKAAVRQLDATVDAREWAKPR